LHSSKAPPVSIGLYKALAMILRGGYVLVFGFAILGEGGKCPCWCITIGLAEIGNTVA
jgi:hypothetical protein